MDAVVAYRRYYELVKLTAIEVTYTKRQPPDWLFDKASWAYDEYRWYIET